MTSKERHIKLIEGTFSAIEAADVLFSLIANKIKFHNLQMLQVHDEVNKKTLHSAKRISELKYEKNVIKDMILKARDEGYEFDIYSAIEVRLKKSDIKSGY